MLNIDIVRFAIAAHTHSVQYNILLLLNLHHGIDRTWR